jgi:hypothetical protein
MHIFVFCRRRVEASRVGHDSGTAKCSKTEVTYEKAFDEHLTDLNDYRLASARLQLVPIGLSPSPAFLPKIDGKTSRSSGQLIGRICCMHPSDIDLRKLQAVER